MIKLQSITSNYLLSFLLKQVSHKLTSDENRFPITICAFKHNGRFKITSDLVYGTLYTYQDENGYVVTKKDNKVMNISRTKPRTLGEALTPLISYLVGQISTRIDNFMARRANDIVKGLSVYRTPRGNTERQAIRYYKYLDSINELVGRIVHAAETDDGESLQRLGQVFILIMVKGNFSMRKRLRSLILNSSLPAMFKPIGNNGSRTDMWLYYLELVIWLGFSLDDLTFYITHFKKFRRQTDINALFSIFRDNLLTSVAFDEYVDDTKDANNKRLLKNLGPDTRLSQVSLAVIAYNYYYYLFENSKIIINELLDNYNRRN